MNWLLIILELSKEVPATHTPDLVHLTDKTACQMYQYLRDAYSWKLLNPPCKLGGPGCIVQIEVALYDLGLEFGLGWLSFVILLVASRALSL